MWHFLSRLIPGLMGVTLAVLNLSASAAPFAYVTNVNSDSVSVIDTATNAVIATVEVGNYQGGIAVNPAGTRAYVSHTGMRTGSVSVIDIATNTVVATIPLPTGDPGGQIVYPGFVAVNPAGTRVYTTSNYFNSTAGGFVYVIDTASNTVVDVAVGAAAGDIAFNHAGTRAYVARQWEPSVSVIDTSTNTIVGTIPVVGGYPTFVAIAPDDTRLYVSNINDGLNPSVSVIDLTSNTVVATVLVGGVPYGVAVNPAGTFAYVPVADKNYVAVIDTRTNTVVDTVTVGASPATIAIGPPVVAANAGPDQSVNERTVVTLNGSTSTGQNLTFSWSQIPGPAVALSDPASPNPSFTAPQLPGGFGSQVLTFTLTVTNAAGSSLDTVDVTVRNVNHAPVAEPGAEQAVTEGSLVALNGRFSFDPDGDPIAYAWTQTVGTLVAITGADTATPSFTAPLIPGGVNGVEELRFALTVSDGALSSIDEVRVIVQQVNHPPTADAGLPQTIHSGRTVTLNGTSSADPDGDGLTFQWQQVSGPAVSLANATTATPSFVAPPVPVTTDLTFRLTVSDTALASAPSDVIVTVKNGAPLCSLARAVPDVLWPPDHRMVPIRIAGVTDPDDDTAGIRVIGVTQDEPVNGLGDGDTSPDAVLLGGTALLRAERSGTLNGRVYQVHFAADDPYGATCTGAVTVSVPRSMKPGLPVINDGQFYDSTQP